MVLLATGGMVVTGMTAQAMIIDDFSSDTSAKYDVLRTSGSVSASYARNGSNQFQPNNNGAEASTNWLRNDGYLFTVGTTISIDAWVATSLYYTSGLSICQSLTDGATNKSLYIQLVPHPSWATEPYQTADPVMTLNGGVFFWDFDKTFSYGPSTISLTRVSDTKLDCTVAYYDTTGTPQTWTGSDTSLLPGAYYFGMSSYGSQNVIMDNLGYTPIPEPAALGLLALGGLVLARRRQALAAGS
jgi:hypothetical protein